MPSKKQAGTPFKTPARRGSPRVHGQIYVAAGWGWSRTGLPRAAGGNALTAERSATGGASPARCRRAERRMEPTGERPSWTAMMRWSPAPVRGGPAHCEAK